MIAIVYPQFYGVQGIARYLDSFLSNLPEAHREIILITGTEEQREIRIPKVKIHHVSLGANRFSLFLWGWEVRRYLREKYRSGEIHAVNVHWPPLIPGLILPSDVPIILTAHTTYLGMSGRFYDKVYYPSEWNPASVCLKRWMESRILSKTAKIIALTEQGRQEVLKYGIDVPIDIISNGADTIKFSPCETLSKDIDVIFSGRIETRKGSRSIALVCQALVAKRPDIKIAIVGYGVDEEFVRNAVAPISKNVVMTGKVPFDEMKTYYERSKVYAATSYYEGLPGTCLEAMAMKLPAVVWDFDFYRALVEDDQTGYRVKPDDFAAMADRISLILDSETMRREMGERSRSLLEANYSWKNLAPKILKVLEHV